VIHHDENPVGSERHRLAPEQVDAPQTVLHMAEEREPGWTSRIGFLRPVMTGEDTAHDVLVDLNAKRLRKSAERFVDIPNWDYAVSCRPRRQ
jgi:hypothetical protein